MTNFSRSKDAEAASGGSASATVVRFAIANGIALRYADDGPRDGAAIVFIHALGSDLHLWGTVAATFAQTHRVIRYDLRGHGASECGSDEASASDQVRDLVGLLDHLQIARATVVGISVGGLIAQAVALTVPTRVQRLVLCATAARIWSEEIWNERIRLVRTGGLEPIADGAIGRWFTPAMVARAPALAKGMRTILVRTPVTGYIAMCTMLRDTDLRAQVSQLRVPTLVLSSEHDPVAPPALGRELANLIPGAHFAELKNVGHLAPVEQPDAVLAQLKAFFDENP